MVTLPRLVAFDFDGTLADSFAVFGAVFDEVTARFGVRRPSPGEIETLRGLPNREVLRRLDVPLVRLPAILRFARTRMAARAGEVTCVPGMPSLVTELVQRRIAVAVVSSNSEAMVRTVLGAALSAQVGTFACGTALFGKAARLRALGRRFGAPSASGVYVGDEERDVAAARRAGMRAVAVSWGYATPPALGAADALCRTVDDLATQLGLRGVR